MSLYFLDSSALVKRYIAEDGTPWVQTITAHNPHVIIARTTWVEILSALTRRQREGSLAAAEVEQVARTLRYDLDTQYQVVELDYALAETAGRLVRQHGLRAYDAIQLAAAVKVRNELADVARSSFIFVAADRRLLEAAQVEVLNADNPHYHL